jgi:hypothetical protein
LLQSFDGGDRNAQQFVSESEGRQLACRDKVADMPLGALPAARKVHRPHNRRRGHAAALGHKLAPGAGDGELDRCGLERRVMLHGATY